MQIPSGCLDDDPGTRPAANIFTAYKASGSVVGGNLPSFPEGPP